MSSKSNAIKQDLKKAKRQVAALKMLVGRMDKGALAIRDIALLYGTHREGCGAREPEGACTCQWNQARGILTGQIGPAQAPELFTPAPSAEVPPAVGDGP